MAPPPYIAVRNVSKTFRSERGDVEALRGVSLSIEAGQFVSVVGPSGCGKSTLLRCIAGLDYPSDGEILLDDHKVAEPPLNMGMVFQRDVLFDWRTVIDNVLIQIEFRGLRRRDWMDRARQLLDLFGIAGFHNRYPWKLSGGMRQRVAICRALIDTPQLLLMDEPFAALDAFTRDELNLEMQKLSQDTKNTAIFVTHNITEAIFLGDQVVVMDRRPGRVADIVRIDLPRPRSLSVRETPRFAAYAVRIRETFEKLGVLRERP